MFSSIYKRTVVAVAASSVLAFGVAAAPASAQTNQTGLVNVSLTDINVPIGIAANICDVQANVLATGNVLDDTGVCTAISAPTVGGGGSGHSTNQTGLVNISATDVNIPIGIAANVCDVQANVLAAGNFLLDDGDCDAITAPTVS